MAFLRSLFAGVSGLRTHQTMMDVIGNNIANVNTIAFKAGRVTFSEMFAQTMRGAGRPVGDNGGTNPMQVGLGTTINTIDMTFSQGNIESTGNPTDLAIQGNGLFVVSKDGRLLYTRAGRFDLDSSGFLVNPGNGAVLQGKMATAAGVIPSGTSLENIVINRDIQSPARATTEIRFAGNLDASALPYTAGPPESGGIVNSSVTAYDSLGNAISLDLRFTKSAGNDWAFTVRLPGTPPVTVGTGNVTFNGDGTLNTITGNVLTFTPPTGGDPMSVTLDFGTPGVFAGLTQTSGTSSVTARRQDGYGAGTLSNISIDAGGRVLGTFSNGNVQTLAQVMVAEFNNPGGLLRVGENMFDVSANSGTPAVMEPGSTTSVVSGALEQSNVDLADEFTRMITAQRGFQANARVITTSDEFLQEVVNLKR